MTCILCVLRHNSRCRRSVYRYVLNTLDRCRNEGANKIMKILLSCDADGTVGMRRGATLSVAHSTDTLCTRVWLGHSTDDTLYTGLASTQHRHTLSTRVWLAHSTDPLSTRAWLAHNTDPLSTRAWLAHRASLKRVSDARVLIKHR